MSRTMPTECDACDGIIDWGDFGVGDGEPTCTCPPVPTLAPPTYYRSNAVMRHGDEIWHHELGRGRVTGWRYDHRDGRLQTGIVARWEKREDELVTWLPSLRHQEIKSGPPPTTTVNGLELPTRLAELIRSGQRIVPKDTEAVDLWRLVEKALGAKP